MGHGGQMKLILWNQVLIVDGKKFKDYHIYNLLTEKQFES